MSSQTENAADPEPSARQRAEKRAQFWMVATCVVAVIGVMIAAYTAWEQTGSTGRITAAIEGKTRAERQLASTSAELQKQRSANRALAKINIQGFLDDYAALLQRVKQASDAYDKVLALPESDRRGALPRAERELYEAAAAFIRFIQQWRVVAAQLDKLLDGSVTRMDNARLVNDAAGLQEALRILIATLPTLRQPLEIEIEKLKSPT
jgi:hypothetical protein